jgi:hypothetical protein
MGRDIKWPDRGERQVALLAPGEKPGARPGVRPARVRVADVGGEEFDIAPARVIPDVSDQRRHGQRRVRVRGRDPGLGDGRRQLGLGGSKVGSPVLDIKSDEAVGVSFGQHSSYPGCLLPGFYYGIIGRRYNYWMYVTSFTAALRRKMDKGSVLYLKGISSGDFEEAPAHSAAPSPPAGLGVRFRAVRGDTNRRPPGSRASAADPATARSPSTRSQSRARQSLKYSGLDGAFLTH